MVSPDDFIRLPYTPDLTQSGIAYAARSLHYTYDRAGGSVFARLRRVAANVGVELALRRHLNSLDIPFSVKDTTHFANPDQYDISLGGRRCDVKSYLITKRSQITQVRHNPSMLLKAPGLIPSDQFASETHRDQDLYLFGFLTGLIALTEADQQKARDAGQPLYFIHPMPREWSRPDAWVPLDRLLLKSECEEPVTIEIGGLDGNREFITTTLDLAPRTLTRVPQPFHAITYAHIDMLPSARIGLHSPVRGAPHLIAPADWGNIWIYGMDILLAGYITREEFRRKSSQIPPGTRVFQYSQTRTKNLAVPIEGLHAIGGLLGKLKQWEEGKQ